MAGGKLYLNHCMTKDLALLSELRSDLEGMKKEHRRIQRDLSNISSSFKVIRHLIKSTRKKPQSPDLILDTTIPPTMPPVPTITIVEPTQDEINDHENDGYDYDDENKDGRSVNDVMFFQGIVDKQCRKQQIRYEEKSKVMEFILFPPNRPRSSSWQLLGSAKLGERVGSWLDRRGSCNNLNHY